MTSTPERRFACALSYRPEEDSAPRIEAAGKGAFAERIIHAAEDAGVAVKEDAELAGMLEALDPFQEIPPELYKPVAILLAAVYKASGRL